VSEREPHVRRGRLEYWQDPPTDAELADDTFNPADFDPDFDYKPEEDDPA
jgi:hypothetical protein